MHFEWDPVKAAENLRKHGVSFEEATSVFFDSLSATGRDPDHSLSEKRYVTFGLSMTGRLLTVAHTDRGNRIRIISARLATRTERKLYEEG
ncbi:MAG TPA: BrnT family toxin [Thermoanaerobaculia bacterium]